MNITHSLKPSKLKVGDLIEMRIGRLYDFAKLRSIEIINNKYVLKFGNHKEIVGINENSRYHICRMN